MKIVFFGTSYFAKEILQFLIEKSFADRSFDIVAIVTQPDKKKVIPPVKKYVKEKNINIPFFQPMKASESQFLSILDDFKADLYIVVAYGQILSQKLLDLPKLDCINIHASLLPKYRGAAPIQRAILNDEKVMGITIMEMEKRLDAGSIIMQKSMKISDEINFKDIEDKLIEISKVLILETISAYKDNSVHKVKQDDSLSTYASKITKSDLKIDFRKTSREIFNQIRAFSPKPGAFVKILIDGKEKILKILECSFLECSFWEGLDIEKEKIKNNFFIDKNNFIIWGIDNLLLKINLVQLEGKKIMDVKAFLRGVKGKVKII